MLSNLTANHRNLIPLHVLQQQANSGLGDKAPMKAYVFFDEATGIVSSQAVPGAAFCEQGFPAVLHWEVPSNVSGPKLHDLLHSSEVAGLFCKLVSDVGTGLDRKAALDSLSQILSIPALLPLCDSRTASEFLRDKDLLKIWPAGKSLIDASRSIVDRAKSSALCLDFQDVSNFLLMRALIVFRTSCDPLDSVHVDALRDANKIPLTEVDDSECDPGINGGPVNLKHPAEILKRLMRKLGVSAKPS